MNLHILDAFEYLYAGTLGSKSDVTIERGVRESAGVYIPNEAPCGGVRYLLSEVYDCIDKGDIIVAFDSTPRVKQNLYVDCFGSMEYKSTRNNSSVRRMVHKQAELSKKILEDVGVNSITVRDYEADDIIYQLVKDLKNSYDNIYIHTRDSDLYFLIEPTVTVLPVRNIGSIIDMHNYSTHVQKDYVLDYNYMPLFKLFHGDTSDHIPPINSTWRKQVMQYFNKEDFKYCGNLDFVRDKLERCVDANKSMPGADFIIPMFNLFMPLDLPNNSYELFGEEIDRDKLKFYMVNVKSAGFGYVEVSPYDKGECILLEYIDDYND